MVAKQATPRQPLVNKLDLNMIYNNFSKNSHWLPEKYSYTVLRCRFLLWSYDQRLRQFYFWKCLIRFLFKEHLSILFNNNSIAREVYKLKLYFIYQFRYVFLFFKFPFRLIIQGRPRVFLIIDKLSVNLVNLTFFLN